MEQPCSGQEEYLSCREGSSGIYKGIHQQRKGSSHLITEKIEERTHTETFHVGDWGLSLADQTEQQMGRA